MRKIILLTLLTINSSMLTVSAQWMQTGFTYEQANALAISGSYIFAGAFHGGVYLSTNSGQTWTYTGMGTLNVLALAISGSNIFAGTEYYGVYLSTNNGGTWTQTSLNYPIVLSIVINGSNIFAGTGFYGVYLSTDIGQTWTQTALNNRNVWSLAISGSNMFAGTQGQGVYVSTNNGQTWTQTPLNNLWVPALAISGSNIIAGTAFNGIFLSTNNGQSWTQASLNSGGIASLAVIGSNVLAGSLDNMGVYLSTNNGLTWLLWNQGMGNRTVWSLAFSADYAYAGSDPGTGQNAVWKRPLSEIVGINNTGNSIPQSYHLYQNYPNPFNPKSKIKYDISKLSSVKLVIYDALGREVVTLVTEQQNPGSYEVEWDGSNEPSGVYFYQLNTGNYSQTRRMLLIK